ncbi:sodium:solute symporter [Halobium palmae]|uniref:Sodium:solute symporter n=1 Tax=Halobium palmae TaxID=1776492 RepID=A0ABD5RVS9_9EURY
MLVYMVGMLGVGAYISQRARESEEMFWVADRFLGTYGGAFAIFAVLGSTSTVLGAAGLAYSLGIPVMAMVALGFALQFPILGYIILNPMVKGGYLTLGDFFKRRGGRDSTVAVYSILTAVFMASYVIPQFVATGLLGQRVLGITPTQAIILTGIVIVLYAAFGGMWAITWTDIIQGVLMIILPALLAIVAIVNAGGPVALIRAGVDANPSMATSAWTAPSVLGLALTWAWFSMGNPQSMLRVFTFKGDESGRRSLLFASIFAGIAVIIAIIVALVAAAAVPNGLENADRAFLVAMDALFPSVFRGVAIAALFAAAMSTTDSLLITASSAICHDVYKGIYNPDAPETRVTRYGSLTILILGAVTVLVAITPGLPLISILTGIAGGAIISAFSGPVVLALHWRTVTSHGMTAGMILGAGVYTALFLFGNLPPLSPILVGVPTSFLGTALVSVLTENEETGATVAT